MTDKDKNLTKDFIDFISSPGIEPSAEVSNSILSYIHQEMNPSRRRLFMKILGIHSIVSIFSLSLCSQFGIQTFPVFDAMNTFMKVMGDTYCLALCGFLYFAMSSLIFAFTLRPEEIYAIRKDRYSQILLLAGVSLGVFLCFGANVLALPSIFWLSGALVGGFGALEVGWRLRSKIRQVIIYGI